MSTIEVYTDGSCIGNPGPGGWAAIIIVDSKRDYIDGWARETTNNRMELTAAIEGLKEVKEGRSACVHSDSEYLVKTMTRGWKRKKNLDLWKRLDAETAKRSVSWQWVEAHAGIPLNEKADRLARKMAQAAAASDWPASQEGKSSLRTLPETLALSEEAQEGAGEDENSASGLTHVDREGRGSMVDVGWKAPTDRMAVAKGKVSMASRTLALIKENAIKKGDVLGIAMVAGITGAKSTSALIPLCHPLPLDQVTVEFDLDEAESSVEITATAKTYAKTGVEMEALTAVSVAALTIYDMCKASDREMKIDAVRLVRKSGGRSGDIELE
jgi:cyclic pyranopterin phosphate synthase